LDGQLAAHSTAREFSKGPNEALIACARGESDLTAAEPVSFLEQRRYAEFSVQLNDPFGSVIQIQSGGAYE